MTIQKFTHGDGIKIQGKKFMHYGKVGTLRAAYDRSDVYEDRTGSNYYRTNWPVYTDFLEEMFRRQEGDRYVAYATQNSLVLTSSSAMREHYRREQDACREVKDGEIVEVDGEKLRVKFVGDYSGMIHFYPEPDHPMSDAEKIETVLLSGMQGTMAGKLGACRRLGEGSLWTWMVRIAGGPIVNARTGKHGWEIGFKSVIGIGSDVMTAANRALEAGRDVNVSRNYPI